MAKKDNNNEKREPIAKALVVFHFFYVTIAILVIIKILFIQATYKLDPSIAKHFRPRSEKVVEYPERGAILAIDGRLLAMSVPMYQIAMDCTVMKDKFKNEPQKEAEWKSDAKKLAAGLARIYKDKSSDEYYKIIIKNRSKGKKYMKIGHPINYQTLQEVKKLPLFNKGAFKGGIIVSKIDTRKYPYGTLARRTIGYVKDNKNSSIDESRHIGLEGKFNYELHGKEGYHYMRITDNKGRIPNYDSTWVKPADGNDIRTTIDIDIQDIADEALRKQIEESPQVEGGCVIVMDVKTGGIRAMVNLLRDSTTHEMNESLNLAIGRSGEPGSVFKAATLMSLLEDNKVTLQDEIPTNHGLMKPYKQDNYVTNYERATNKDVMTVLHGFKISSNYIFRKLVIDNYGSNPKKFTDKLYLFKLGEDFDFDIDGLSAPYIPSTTSKYWSGTDLGQIAIGYNVQVTPLHTVTFYNAIANKGVMVKPYLVEDTEKNGTIIKKFGPSYLSGRICSKMTADTLTRALSKVTEEGTGRRVLSKAACTVAGKTGTSRIAQGKHGYEDEKGRIQYQATFVGFFPAENPKYTAICVLYSIPGTGTLYGGTLPAKAFREIVDKTYVLDATNGGVISKKGKMPKLNKN